MHLQIYAHRYISLFYSYSTKISKRKEPVISRVISYSEPTHNICCEMEVTRVRTKLQSQTLEQLTSLKSHTGHSGYFHIAEKRTVTVQRYLRAKSRRPAAAHSGRGCGEPGAATGEPWQEEARWAEPCGRTPGRSEGRAEPPPAGTERGGAARGRYRRGWGCEALVTALPGAQPRDLPRRCCCRRRRRRGPECGAERGPPTTRPPRWAGPCRRFSARGLPGTVVLEEPRGRREL